MKKFTPNGAAIKRIRGQLERLSTQKEFAHEIGVSERTLRQIENENLPISINIVDRISKVLNVHRAELVYAIDLPKIVPVVSSDPLGLIADFHKERLVPRYDYDIANTTMDEGNLFKECRSSHDVMAIIETTLSVETSEYAEELFEIVTSLSWSKRSILDEVSATEEIAIRRANSPAPSLVERE